MLPGPAKILSCPFCGGEQEVMSLLSGNTYGGTVWSDTRRHYPMLPEVSPIQHCPHCGKYYFLEQSGGERPKRRRATSRRYSGDLGSLSYGQLREAAKQMEVQTLTNLQRWILNHQLFMAYNDDFRRNRDGESLTPTADDMAYHTKVIWELLAGIDGSRDYDLFHAELLR